LTDEVTCILICVESTLLHHCFLRIAEIANIVQEDTPMFSIFNKNKKSALGKLSEQMPVEDTDKTLIAVITAAIVRFRESESDGTTDAGFIVRRIRRI